MKSITDEAPNGTYENLVANTANDSDWVQLKTDYTHSESNTSFLYVKGPVVENKVGVDYFIDDFSLVKMGADEVDFSKTGDIIDIGAYEYSAPLSVGNIDFVSNKVIAHPNPVTEIFTLINLQSNDSVFIYDILGNKIELPQTKMKNIIKINASYLSSGIYFVNIISIEGSLKTIKIIKE